MGTWRVHVNTLGTAKNANKIDAGHEHASSPVTHIVGSWVIRNTGNMYRDPEAGTYCVSNWAARAGHQQMML